MRIELGRLVMGEESVIEFRHRMEVRAFACLLCDSYENCARKITFEKIGKRENEAAATCVSYIEGEGAGGENCRLSP